MSAVVAFRRGEVLGHVALSASVLAAAKSAAVVHFADCIEADFCGDPVEDVVDFDWVGDVDAFLVDAGIEHHGLRRRVKAKACVVATATVDAHVDDINGPCLAIVLHNDGLRFKQGRQFIDLNAGDWFVFDDRIAHEVRETKDSTSLVCLIVPVEASCSTS